MKQLLLILTGALCVTYLVAQNVSKELATRMAILYMQKNNGSYALNSLEPSGHNYNNNQEAILGIEPDYPNCSSTEYAMQQSDVNTDNFEIYKGGAIAASNITINSNRSGVILSGEAVTLGCGFTIKAGSHVLIDVRDMHCNNVRNEIYIDEDISNVHYAPHKQATISSLSATKILRDGHLYIIVNEKEYTADGMLIR